MKQITIILLLFFSFAFYVKAQDICTIRGKITDKETGEALVGAMLIIEDVEPVIAVLTDYEGNYSLENIPVNIEKIVISFMSYKTKVIENLHLISGNTKIYNHILEKVTEDIGEVVVSAKSITHTDAAINTIQKNSSGIINGVSSQQISKLGDGNAGSALKRVSGVSVSGGKYVFVRGLSDRYSKTTLNGAEIPGLDPNKNTVQMDMFPSNIIDNIIVHKSFTPDLPASFTGGYINITTKSYPEKFTLRFSSSVGYNPQANLNVDFLSYEGGKYDALGFDDGKRAIPEIARDDVPFLFANNEKLDKITASFNKIMSSKTQKSFLNHSHSFSIGNQIKLFGKPFGFVFSSSYDRKFKYYDNGIYARYNLVESSEAADVMNAAISEKEIKGEEEIMFSVFTGLSYKLNKNSKLNLSVLRINNGLKSARYREGSKSVHDIYMHEHTLGFQERKLASAQLSGKHILTGIFKAKLNWLSSYTLSKQEEPDLRFFNFDSDNGNYSISPNAYTSPARFYRFMTENNTDNKIDVEIPVKIAGKISRFKIGGAFTLKSRNSDETKFDILSQGVDFNGNISEYLSDENIGQNATGAEYGIYMQNDKLTDAYNSYAAQETIISGFGMFAIDFSKKIKLITGLRYENDYIFIENKVSETHHKYVRAKQIYPDFLPVLNTRYLVTKDVNLRFVYAKTVARPAFKEIAPYAVYDFKEGWRVVGNPDLKRTLIDNVDLRLEKFGRRGDNISASIFYKFFRNPIELIDDPRAANPEFHYVNIEKSKLYGIEFEVKKHLKAINLNNFTAGGNFTYLKSEVEFADNYTGDENAGLIKRPMYEQAPWVINTYLFYNNDKIGLNSNVSFNMEGQKLAVVTKGNTPNIYKQSFPDLKINISKTLAEKFSVKFSVSNVLNQDYKKKYDFKGTEYIFQSHTPGRTYSFSVSYDIN